MPLVRHATCGEMAERDEYGYLHEPHKSNTCRPNSAHHPQHDKGKSGWKLGRTGASGGR